MANPAYRRKRRTIRAGQAIMAVGLAIGALHLLEHIGAFGRQPSGWEDLLVGYPTAGLVVLAGGIVAGR